jgi:hypothetical protein
MAITSILKLYCNCFLLSEGLLAILLPGKFMVASRIQSLIAYHHGNSTLMPVT